MCKSNGGTVSAVAFYSAKIAFSSRGLFLQTALNAIRFRCLFLSFVSISPCFFDKCGKE